MSIIQACCQSIGNVTGGLVLLKLTSEEFAEKNWNGSSHLNPPDSFDVILYPCTFAYCSHSLLLS